MSRCTCTPPMFDLDCPVHGKDVAALVVEAIDEGRVIQEQPPGRCELCGAVEETRPYGPNGEEVCFDCGMKNEDAAKRAFEQRIGSTRCCRLHGSHGQHEVGCPAALNQTRREG